MKKELKAFERLLNIMQELRTKCPWDRKQTMESLRNLTIEETYELADSILQQDMPEIKKELGDLLLHIVFYSRIAEEQKAFDITDVMESLCDKLVERHPHVFGDTRVKDSKEVEENWEEIKMKEGQKSILAGVPDSLPALIKSNRIQQKVRGVGFDWDQKEQIWDKVKEELDELQQEINKQQKEEIESEFGDLLFSIINAARLYDIDPENALEKTNKKFIKRFKYLEEHTINKGKSLKNMTLDDMNVIWEKAKKDDEKKDGG
ncbi:MAG: nucleoside triphosphate pyrophosphohydrolase [Bacteroidales bacterium]|nr:nucleoside triphosphate pyrophosphohydrolase [Bacteroidales bacterium]MBS3773904.1 nucleoside triphosphate pyrophosphohydrolase [Bacteroidales bacterium]